MIQVSIVGEVDEVIGFLGYGSDDIDAGEDCPMCETPGDSTDTGDENDAKAENYFVSEGILDRRPFMTILRHRVIEMAVDRGAPRALAEKVVGEVSDTPFLDWLRDGGLEMILKFVLAIIGALA